MKVTTRMSSTAPWPCPTCGAQAGEKCKASSSAKSTYLPQMHIARWERRNELYPWTPMSTPYRETDLF